MLLRSPTIYGDSKNTRQRDRYDDPNPRLNCIATSPGHSSCRPMAVPNGTTSYNIFENQTTGDLWKSTTAGLSIGQNYCCINNPDQSGTKYLAKTDQIDLITLIDSPPKSEDSHALQREFLAAVSTIVATNSVPSRDFIAAIETTIENVRSAMPKFWFDYATAGLLDGISRFQGKEIFDMA